MAKKPKIKMKKLGDVGVKFPVVEVPLPGLYNPLAEGEVKINGVETKYSIGVAVNLSAFYYFVENP
jgi:hypothetical protein